jgi:hypothetical protein
MRVVLSAVGVLLMNLTPGFAASCPSDDIALLGRDCADADLVHVYKEHCNRKADKSEFEEHYCKDLKNLKALCVHASEHPARREELNCYATGEEGEIIGYTVGRNPTSCYRVVFETSGFGKVKLKTMYPVVEAFCN